MEEWIASGVQLGWLIEGAKEIVHIYRVNRPPEIRREVLKLASEGPVRASPFNCAPLAFDYRLKPGVREPSDGLAAARLAGAPIPENGEL